MLTEKRIKEAENNVKNYLSEGLLKKYTSPITKTIYLKNAKDSLVAANLMFEKGIYLWTVITSYYAMFYSANAVLNHFGHKLGAKIVHKVTADALIVIIRNKLNQRYLENFEEVQEEALRISKTDDIIESFDFERRKRNFIQYQTPKEDIRSKAKTSLDRAKEFLFEMETLLD